MKKAEKTSVPQHIGQEDWHPLRRDDAVGPVCPCVDHGLEEGAEWVVFTTHSHDERAESDPKTVCANNNAPDRKECGSTSHENQNKSKPVSPLLIKNSIRGHDLTPKARPDAGSGSDKTAKTEDAAGASNRTHGTSPGLLNADKPQNSSSPTLPLREMHPTKLSNATAQAAKIQLGREQEEEIFV